MATDTIVLFYVPCPDAEVADRIAQGMVAEGLAACANRLGAMQAHFVWQGAVATEAEIPLLLKVAPERAEAAMARLAALHPYDLPTILSWPVRVTPDFAAWVGAARGPAGDAE